MRSTSSGCPTPMTRVRSWRRLSSPPSRELSAADLAAVVGGTRNEASRTLDRLVDEEKARRRQEEDFVLYLRKRRG
jgi:hypothetical protein